MFTRPVLHLLNSHVLTLQTRNSTKVQTYAFFSRFRIVVSGEKYTKIGDS